MRATNMKRLLTGFLAAAMVFTSVPVTQAQAAKKQTTITVTTQAELNAALAKKGVKSIVIKTSQNITLKLPDSDSKAKLIVDAPNAKITNNAKLAGITIKDAKAFTEKSEKGNSIIVTDKKVSLTVAAKAENVSVKAAAKNADISLKVNGELKKLTVDKKADITVKGYTDKTVTIVNNAKGSAVDVKVESAKMTLTKPADVKIAEGTNVAKMTVKTDANIEVAKGAVVGKVVVTGKDASVAIEAHGEVAKVDVNSKAEVALTGTTDKKVELNVNAADASVSTAVKTDVNVNANAQITIEKGAEGSAVAKADGVETKVSNSSADKVAIKDAKGNESSIEAGTSVVSNDEGTKETTKDDNKEPEKKPENTTGGGGSSGSSSDPFVKITGIELLKNSESVEVGKTVKLTPVYKPSNATNKKVSWSVDKGDVASVDQNGNVTGKKVDTCTVTVTTDQMGYKASCTINVTKATLTGITLSQTSATMYVDDTLKLSASAVPAAAELESVTWTSSSTEVATVENGTVTAKKAGSATITCENGEIKAECIVTVEATPADQTMVKLTFMADGTTLATKNVVSGAALADVQPTVLTKTGYEFKDWAESADGTVVDAIIYNAEAITLYAKYEAKTYKITFIGADEEVFKEFPVQYNGTVTVPEGNDTESDTFVGWSTVSSATTAEVNAGEQITCTGDATYYYIGKWRACKVEASGNNVRFYYGAWKSDENLDKNLSDVNGKKFTDTGSLTGYLGYVAGQNEPVGFVVDSGYKITGITVDDTALSADELKAAIANCYVNVSRASDHTIVIATAKIEVTVAAVGDKATLDVKEHENGDGEKLTWNYVTVTASAVKLSDVVTISPSNIDNPTFEYKYNKGDESLSGNNFYALDPNSTSLEAGTYEIHAYVMENGTQIDKIYIILTVNAPNTSTEA